MGRWTRILIGFASAMAGALAPISAMAQYTYPQVNFAIGEWEKTIAGHRQSSGSEPTTITTAVSTSRVCGLPNASDLRARIQAFVADGTLAQEFATFETAWSTNELGSPSAAATALFNFLGNAGVNDIAHQIRFTGSPGYGTYSLVYSNLTPSWDRGESYKVIVDLSCLTYVDTRTWVLALRKVIRTYLGLPPPQ